MNDQHFASRVRQNLNSGLQDLPPAVSTRLAAARQRALAHQKVAVSKSALATAGSVLFHQFDHVNAKQVLVALALAASLVLYTQWDAERSVAELEAIDSALLSDDLPINAFTDKGFDAWLKSTPSQE